MLYIYLPVLYYHGNIHVTEGAFAGGRGFPLSQRSFLFMILFQQDKSVSYVKIALIRTFNSTLFSWSFLQTL